MVRIYSASRIWRGKKTLTIQFKSGYGHYHDEKHKFEKEKERFITSRADCFVFASGYFIL